MNPGPVVRRTTRQRRSEQETRSIGSRYSDRPVCKPANPAFTISKMMTCARIWVQAHVQNTDIPSRTLAFVCNLLGFAAKVGGADRDRTDDLKLAKLALSQLSYGPSDRRSADR